MTMAEHRTGTRQEWLAARRKLLDAEKEYAFETDNGKKTLAELSGLS